MAVYVNGKKVAGKGISGKSPYQIAQGEGYTGTEQDFNTQLKAIGDAVAGFNELTNQVNNAKNDVEAAVAQAQTNINNIANAAKNNIDAAVAEANQALEDIEDAKQDIETTVAQAKSEIEQAKQEAINSIPNAANLLTQVWYYGSDAPDTGKSGGAATQARKLLWIDSNSDTGGLKYYNNNSGAWTHIPVAWT